jgi:hypothetical protein
MAWAQQALLGNLLQIRFFAEIRRQIAAQDGSRAERFDRILAKEFLAATRLIGEGCL